MAAHQASLSITNSRGLLKLMSIESYRKNYFCFFCLKRQLGIISIFKSSPSVLSCVQVQMLVTQWCWILCNPIDCSPPGSSVHGIFQARILKCIAISSSGGCSEPSLLQGGRFFTAEPPGKPYVLCLVAQSCPTLCNPIDGN